MKLFESCTCSISACKLQTLSLTSSAHVRSFPSTVLSKCTEKMYVHKQQGRGWIVKGVRLQISEKNKINTMVFSWVLVSSVVSGVPRSAVHYKRVREQILLPLPFPRAIVGPGTFLRSVSFRNERLKTYTLIPMIERGKLSSRMHSRLSFHQ